ncbi:CheF family chemotaxis protein [Methanocaldococcus sp.]
MKFYGVGFLLARRCCISPFSKWEKIEVELIEDTLNVYFEDKSIAININDIVDVGAKVPEKLINLSKKLLEGVYNISSIIFKQDDNLYMLAIGAETSIYGEYPVKSMLREIIIKFIADKDVKVVYDIKNKNYWSGGKFIVIKRKYKENFITKIEYKLIVESNKEYFDIFSNLKNFELENEYLKLIQHKLGRKVISYLYIPDTEVRFFLLRYLKSIMNYNVGILKDFEINYHFEIDDESVESWF